ncbi:GntR family transcriptional regulator [Fervidobacterium gondwanense]|uniref:Transcriptional regulator, GntR family n=1 Tax=Fervidobacterium gondwanense DSM 13020 TaxID=1121883 RepID=A0A1M7SJW7_FERGO|nr:GntR family transcriptional regulator [Fervidobacterium gondwanense]SHN58753.1 transcriptional regulator, GntR family [Fervidobacterium gondwanense DSM 13020]
MSTQYMNFQKVDKHSGIPAYLQIVNQIKAKILLGDLKVGMQLPTVRELEKIFDVNINTVLKAFERLKLEGLVQSEQGIGYFISGNVDVSVDVLNDVYELVRTIKKKGLDLLTALKIIEEVWKNV